MHSMMLSLDHVISLQDSVLSCDPSGLKEAMKVRFKDTEQTLIPFNGNFSHFETFPQCVTVYMRSLWQVKY